MPYNEAACNSSGSFLLRRVGLPSTLPTIGNVFSLNNGTTVIGRNPTTSDIFLDSAVHKALISRLHARITTDQNASKVTICDTSLNGTYVNDKKILDTEEVRVGDTITFGHLKGAVLEPGVVAKQHKSEFVFKLEKCAPQSTYHPHERSCAIYPCNINSTSNSDGCIQETSSFLPDLSPFLNSTEEDSCESQDIEKQQTPKPCLLDTNGINLYKETSDNLDIIQDSEDDDDIAIIQTNEHKNSRVASGNHTKTPSQTPSSSYNIDLATKNIRDIKKTIMKTSDVTTVTLNGLPKDKLNNRSAITNNEQPQVFSNDANKLDELGDSECDNDELLAFAVAAEDCMDDDLSDSELFSVDIGSFDSLSSKIMPPQSNDNSPCRASFYFRDEVKDNNRKMSPLTIDTFSTAENQNKSLKRPKKGRPSKKKKALKATPSFEKNVPETCGFKSDCLRPHDREELVEWVQCDYCKKWYHLECTGLTLDKVDNMAVKFNCGCVYAA